MALSLECMPGQHRCSSSAVGSIRSDSTGAGFALQKEIVVKGVTHVDTSAVMGGRGEIIFSYDTLVQ